MGGRARASSAGSSLPGPPAERIRRFALGQPRRRLIGLLVVMLVMLGYVLFRVGRLQTIGGEPLREAGADQWTRQVELEADRGTIFDRNGEELAVSIPAASISVNPKLVSDPEGTVRTLTTVLGLTDQEQADLYAALVAQDKGFVYVKRQVDVSIGQQIADLELSGVNVDAEDRRVLPGGETGPERDRPHRHRRGRHRRTRAPVRRRRARRGTGLHRHPRRHAGRAHQGGRPEGSLDPGQRAGHAAAGAG